MGEDRWRGIIYFPGTFVDKYPYVGNNPANLVDPAGEIAPIIFVAALVLILGGISIGGLGANNNPNSALNQDPSTAFQRQLGCGMIVGGSAGVLLTPPVLAASNLVAAAADPSKLTLSGKVAGQVSSRPYVNSPLLTGQIIRSGIPFKDPTGSLAYGAKWVVPGTMKGAPGTYELVVDLSTNRIVRYLFHTKGAGGSGL